MSQKDLDSLFKPKSVAVIGASASPSKIGHQILNNLVVGNFRGDIFPINPKEDKILDLQAYKSVLDVPKEVDLAIISIPAKFVIPSIEECAQKGVKSIALITSGFAEVGNIEEEQRIKDIVDKHNIALLGPNILGLVYVPENLNASFGPREMSSGKIAFISQSGALAIALMGWTVMEKIGLSALVSMGNKADIGEEELIEYFNNDDNVDVIMIYMEGLKDTTKFMKINSKKPVVILKVGRSQRGARAAASHTGSLAGSDKIYESAFKQLGILRARNFNEAFGWAEALSLPEPKGEDTVIITNGGGIGVSATDECEAAGIKLLDDPEWLEEKFRSTMPDFGSTKNPVDITGQGGIEGYRKAIKIALQEERVDAVIVLYCQTVITDPMDIAKVVVEEYEISEKKKPLVVNMVGGEKARDAIYFLSDNGIPACDAVQESISALKILYTWKEISTRQKDDATIEPPPQEAIDIIENVRKDGREILLEHEARKVMELCGVPTPKWAFASNEEEAVDKAKDMYPLAMKIASPDIVHKTDVGGVVINIRTPDELRLKYNSMMEHIKKVAPEANLDGVNLIQMVKGIECIVGMSRDPQFGPVVMFGLGGIFVEALKDVSFRVVPFGELEAARLINDIKTKNILKGFRGFSADKPSIIKTLCAIQRLTPYVKEVDINPLITNNDGSFAVDARIII